jgi:hypothetical protein
LAFESDSKLTQIESGAFSCCTALGSISLPSQLTRIESGAFACCSALKSICIPSSVEVLSDFSFSYCICLSALTFESDSKLTQIGKQAFSDCSALKSICIPQSIRALKKDWFNESSLSRVIFESGASLQTMIESGEVDLNGNFDIFVFGWDGVMTFPGYSVSIPPDTDNCFLLVKNK